MLGFIIISMFIMIMFIISAVIIVPITIIVVIIVILIILHMFTTVAILAGNRPVAGCPGARAQSVRSAPCTRPGALLTPHMDIGSEIMEDDDIPSVTRARPPAMAAPAAPRLHNRDADAAPRNSSAMPTPRPRGSITAHARWANGFAAATGANASERGLLGLPRLLPQPPAPPAEGGNDRLIVIIIIIVIIV